MTTIFGWLLKKTARSSEGSAGRNGNRYLPKKVYDYLEKEFRLSTEDMTTLRCVRCGGTFGGEPVKLCRIFDQGKAQEQGVVIRRYADLDKYIEFVVFEGQLFRDGKVCLDRKKDTSAIGVKAG